MATEVKKARKPRAKKTAKKVEEVQTVQQPQTQQVQLKIEDVITWDDAKCNEMNVQFPLIQVRDILRRAKAVEDNYNVLRTVLVTGAMTGYSVECPKCHNVEEVNPTLLIRNRDVECPKCGASYNQVKAIRGITTYEEKKENA